MTIENVKVSWKSLIPLVLMACAALALVAVGVDRLGSVSSAASEIIENRDAAAVHMLRAAFHTRDVTVGVLASIAYDGDTPEGKAADDEFKGALAAADAEFDMAQARLPDRAGQIGAFETRFAALVKQAQEPYEIGDKTPGIVHGRDLKPEDIDLMAQAGKLVGPVDMGIRALFADITKFNDALLAENAAAARDFEAQSKQATWWLAGIGVGATLLIGVFAYWLMTSTVAHPLGEIVGRMEALAAGRLDVVVNGQQRGDEIGAIARAVDVFKRNAIDRARLEDEAAAQRARAEADGRRTAEERAKAAAEQSEAMRRLGAGLKNMSNGDLTVRLADGFTADYAQIRDDFNDAVEMLKGTIAAVVAATGAIESGALEVTGSADDLSQRTEQQASSLEETSASLTEVTATVQKSAEGTRHAREVVAAADKDAKDSANVVNRAVEAMNAIAKSSQEIGKIIGVIDEIAFQTNLLALNAGVEAARAGDAGKGFAVVASEVRALAQRSAEAAKEIKSLISTSDTQVLSGVELVAETGRSLQRIVAKVAEINNVVADIATGAQEQSTALQQINTAIEQMSSTTQANAAMVEESTAAGHSLSQESSKLARVVAEFRVGGSSSVGQAELARVSPRALRERSALGPRAKAS